MKTRKEWRDIMANPLRASETGWRLLLMGCRLAGRVIVGLKPDSRPIRVTSVINLRMIIVRWLLINPHLQKHRNA
ncbi:MAG: hypothetical protein HOP02_04145 [Methylococcaceae bacterium]|nr:hypothetical protein [Methylococcaceae bacterium]